MQNKIGYGTQAAVFMFLLVFIISCIPAKELNYFSDIDKLDEPITNPREQKLIMPFDNLYVRVISIDEKTNTIFNTPSQLGNNYNSSTMFSYSVDEVGNINFPFVGKINIGSLTTVQAGLKIQSALNEYISNTSVIVKYIDNKVTIMGQVEHQGQYTFTQDKLSIYEALSLGGGITRFGDRKKVILVRQEGAKIMHYKLDLTDSKIANRNYYFVLPNDVVIVETMKQGAWGLNNNTTFTTILTTLTTLMAVYITFFKGKL
jgi:polysaccharide biosynthesis/export protein